MRRFDLENAWLWCASLLLSLLIFCIGYPVLAPIVSQPPAAAPAAPRPVTGDTDGCGDGAITVSSPLDQEVVSFPLRVTGTVDNRGVASDCRWIVFEGEAGTATLRDADGREVGKTLLPVFGEWMTEGPVDFSGTIAAPARLPAKGRLTLTLQDSNPRDDVAQRSLEVPLVYGSRCDLRPDPGYCRAAVPKFFFDPAQGKCQQFLWGGCAGEVPFGTLSGCQATCEH